MIEVSGGDYGVFKKAYEHIVQQILRPTVHKISLYYCVSTTELYEVIKTVKKDGDPDLEGVMDANKEKDRFFKRLTYVSTEDTVRYSKHLSRIIDKIATDDDFDRVRRLFAEIDEEENTDNPEGKEWETHKLFRPTIFSQKIQEAMLREHNYMAKKLGMPPYPVSWKKLIGDRSMWSLSGSENLKTASSFYAFPEFVLLACLCLSLQKSSVDVLNAPIDPQSQGRRARARFRKIKQTLMAQEFRQAVVATFFNLLAMLSSEEYEEVKEEHMRWFWLPPKYRTTEYLEYAKKHYRYDEYQVINKELPAEEMRKYITHVDHMELAEFFFLTICPVAEMMVLGVIPIEPVKKIASFKITSEDDEMDLIEYVTSSEKLEEETRAHFKAKGSYKVRVGEYTVATKVAKVVNSYIDLVFEDVVRFLKCLPETKGLGAKSFFNFFNEL